MPIKKKSILGGRTLSVDVGGSGIKASVLGSDGALLHQALRIPTPYPCTPKVLVKAMAGLAGGLPAFGRAAVGFPGFVQGGRIVTAPHFGNKAWEGFDLAAALGSRLGVPVRVLNDADMQGLAAIQGRGLELVITLGTGVGTALFREGDLMPHLELAHHPLHKGRSYNQHLGDKALKKAGKKKWNQRLESSLEVLRSLFHCDMLYVGGGNARKIQFKLGKGTKRIPNLDGIRGGHQVWKLSGELFDGRARPSA
jgi:polyphosphate glucokinase